MKEIYKAIKGYESSYEVSNLGNIKSKRKPHRSYEKVLKPIKVTGGYLAIDLGDGVKIKRFLVHRLVGETFLNNKENKSQINHINGIKTDNRIENLEWNTRSENQLHSIRTGLRTTKGIKNSQCKLNEEAVMRIFFDKRKYKEISEDFIISIPTVSDIKRGHSWSHITGMNRNQTLTIK